MDNAESTCMGSRPLPVGCGGAAFVLLVVLVTISGFVGAVWWGMHDLGVW